MPAVRKSAIVDRPAASMYELVDDVERYPEFLPWCASAQVLERTEEVTQARMDVDYHGLKTHITTRNVKDAPHGMTLEIVEGPFDRFRGRWRFVPLGPDGCRVEFHLDYALASNALAIVLGPVFGYIADTLVERFVERAEALGKPKRRRGKHP